MIADDAHRAVRIVYTNYRGETDLRVIVPRRLETAETDWHPEKQLLLHAFDLDRQAERSFAVRDIVDWLGNDGLLNTLPGGPTESEETRAESHGLQAVAGRLEALV